MIIDKEILTYLEGEKFSNGRVFNLPNNIQPEHRIEYLTNLVKGKKVVHLGCLDHLPLIGDKIKKGEWLHARLTESAEKCVGFDINEETAKEVEEKYGIDNITCLDITAEANEAILAEKWDYLILGELLEHIDNPVEFLSRLREYYKDSIDQIVITVPHILNINRMKEMKKCIEIINTDHRFWFTPYTIAKVATEAGIKPTEVLYKSRGPLSFGKLVYRKMYKTVLRKEPTYPFYYFNNLILVGTLK